MVLHPRAWAAIAPVKIRKGRPVAFLAIGANEIETISNRYPADRMNPDLQETSRHDAASSCTKSGGCHLDEPALGFPLRLRGLGLRVHRCGGLCERRFLRRRRAVRTVVVAVAVGVGSNSRRRAGVSAVVELT